MHTGRNDPAVIRDVLTTPGTWAIVGLGDNPLRTAYRISRWLRDDLGRPIVPIHPSAATVHGAPGYARLAEVPDDLSVAVVDCFVNSSLVGAVVDDAIAQRHRLGIRAVWMQLGVRDAAASERAAAAGLAVVVDACPLIEYPKLRTGH